VQEGVITSASVCVQEEVIEWVNAVRYGLAGSIWTTNLTQAHKYASLRCWSRCCCRRRRRRRRRRRHCCHASRLPVVVTLLTCRVAAKIDSGLLWVNTWLHRDLRTAFGGVKDSGVGREGGKYSLEFYSEYKNVCVFLGR
jgi:aminomuconate-semialdehyde/2-hydroxymuconate-6-semialdehyde dehydrogenase